MKKMFRLAVVGCVVGGLLSTWLCPKVIAWYFNPPIETALNCKAPIEWALHKLQLAQLFGTIAGGVLFALLSLTLFKGKEEPSLEELTKG